MAQHGDFYRVVASFQDDDHLRLFSGVVECFLFALGLDKAGNDMAAPQAVSKWLAPKERGVAIGFYRLDAAISATLASISVVAIATK